MLHIKHLEFIGLLLIFQGIFLRWIVGHRRFRRRTITGLEWFSSYTKAVLTRMVEGLIAFLAKLFIMAGILLILAASV